MEALSYEEYEAYSGKVDEAKFNALIKKAQIAIEAITNGFYFDTDKLETELASVQYNMRALYYKHAIAYQIDYYDEMGATTVAALNKKPVSQSIGSTSINYGEKGTDSSGNVARVSAESLDVLGVVGLLYRGGRLWKRC